MTRRLWAVVLTGVPFGIFKVGGGLAAAEDLHAGIGLAFVAWGALDILLNLLSLVFKEQLAHCLLSNLGRRLDRARGTTSLEPLLLAIDTLLTFAIVSSMIWLGRIATLPQPLVRIWELAVITNILSVGVERVWRSRPGTQAEPAAAVSGRDG